MQRRSGANTFGRNGWTNILLSTSLSFFWIWVADPTNRRLLAYERLNSAKQQQGQKVSVFKAYLEELESHVTPLSEEFRVNSFLTKLRPELKSKILSTGSVPTTRDSLLALAIMQEKNLERYHPTPRSSGKGKPLEGTGVWCSGLSPLAVSQREVSEVAERDGILSLVQHLRGTLNTVRATVTFAVRRGIGSQIAPIKMIQASYLSVRCSQKTTPPRCL